MSIMHFYSPKVVSPSMYSSMALLTFSSLQRIIKVYKSLFSPFLETAHVCRLLGGLGFHGPLDHVPFQAWNASPLLLRFCWAGAVLELLTSIAERVARGRDVLPRAARRVRRGPPTGDVRSGAQRRTWQGLPVRWRFV